jgi:hypothetical protein
MAANKRVGKKSLAQNDFLAPSAPINVSATDVGTSRPFNNGAAIVTFSLPAGSQAATSYTVTSSTGQSNSGSSSPITVSGIPVNSSVTFIVTATNASGTSQQSSPSAAIAITTVPNKPLAPTVSSPSAGSDSVSWSAPSNGGKAITGYYWTSSDGKSGNTSITSVSVSQEQGTSQTYNVRATNANGNSETSNNSASVTTAFAFFSVFSFFGVFNFFSVFGFYGYNFSFFSIGSNTQVLTTNSGYKKASDVEVGEELVAMNIPNPGSWLDWSTTDTSLLSGDLVSTTVVDKNVTMVNDYIYIDGELFTSGHFIMTRKDGIIKFTRVADIDTTYEKYSYVERDFVPIINVDNVEIAMEKVSFQCEPYDNFFTDQMLILDQPDEYVDRMNQNNS